MFFLLIVSMALLPVHCKQRARGRWVAAIF